MDKPFSLDDIDPAVAGKVYTQKYGDKKNIDGIKIMPVHTYLGEDSDFSEVLKLSDGKSDFFAGFMISQINRSTQFPGSIKAWHLHFLQDELWFVPVGGHLLIGLWDVRKDSPTKGATSRIVLGGSTANLLFIPHGVAHGSANNSREIIPIIYFVNKYFDKSNPDEQRIAWDALGAQFWQTIRD